MAGIRTTALGPVANTDTTLLIYGLFQKGRVLAQDGVAPDGQKRLLSLRLAVSEASTHWGSVLEGLQARGLRAPKLVISDGHKGLTKALEKWPGCRLQRCTEHKRANLLQHCPAHARRELRR